MTESRRSFRIRRIDRALDAAIPDRPFRSFDAAERARRKLQRPGEFEVYQYSSGSTIPSKEKQEGAHPRVFATLPADDLAYARELAERQGRSVSSVLAEGVGLVREKNGDG